MNFANNRKEEERQFHDRLRNNSFGQRWSPDLEKTIKRDALWNNMKYYSVERKSRRVVLDWFADKCRGKKVLDYCCGNGDDSFIIAEAGAKEVVGIDISEISIRNCKERILREGLEKNASFYVMDAECLDFDNDCFDIVAEYGVLHHLDLMRAYSEIARVLKPEGRCICTETLGHNPLIRCYRKNTPHLRTEWEVEHILRKENIEMARKHFDNIKILGFFHLATLAAVPFRNTPIFNGILSVFEKVDSLLLKLPGLKWQAWQVVFELFSPKNKKSKGRKLGLSGRNRL